MDAGARLVTDDYLKNDQFKDSSKLARRANLLVKYGKGDWFSWLAERAGFAGGQSVLDIGCGAGWFWQAVADSLPDRLDVTLADQSEGMVNEALGRAKQIKPLMHSSGLVADVCAMRFADASFDRVLAFHMLYHAPDQPAALAEIARVLKPDGVALVSTNGVNHMATADRLRQSVFNLPDQPMINFTLENAPPLLEAVFGRVTLQTKSDLMRVTDPQDVLAYLTSFPPGDSASPAQIKKLEAAVSQAFGASGGVFEIPIETGVFICSR